MIDKDSERREYYEYQSDEDFHISQCAYCKHKGNGRYCDAFDEIPMSILLNEVDHRQPINGDRNIQFEPNEGVSASKLDRLFK